MAKTTTKRRLSLENGETSTAALPSIRSVYDLVGIRDTRYSEHSFAAYSASIGKMDLSELHDEAADKGLPSSPDRGYMIQLLEEKFLRDNPAEREIVTKARQTENARADKLTIAQRAARIAEQAR